MVAPGARDAAKKAGLKRYFTGQPCSAGHIVERLVVNGQCTDCIKEGRKRRKEQRLEYQRKHRKEKPELYKSYGQKYYQDHLEENRRKAREKARANKEIIALRMKDYYSRPDVVERRRSYRRAYARKPEVMARRRELVNRKNRTDIMARLNNRMRCRMWHSLRGGKNGKSWESLVGYSVEELKAHLESRFLPGMGWHNMGEWHIDHIFPVSRFNFKSADDLDFYLCWSLRNLQPLWAIDNHKKHAKVA